MSSSPFLFFFNFDGALLYWMYKRRRVAMVTLRDALSRKPIYTRPTCVRDVRTRVCVQFATGGPQVSRSHSCRFSFTPCVVHVIEDETA